VICPVNVPAAVGVNWTSSTALCPGFKTSGAVSPESVNPAPVIEMELMVTGEVPDAVSVIDCSAGELIRTLPNGILEAFAVSTAVPGVSWIAKLFVMLPAVAFSVAVCVALTALTLAEKEALIAPGGTVTDAGTVTEELLLASETVNPAPAAAP